jgi:hypothetical protein
VVWWDADARRVAPDAYSRLQAIHSDTVRGFDSDSAKRYIQAMAHAVGTEMQRVMKGATSDYVCLARFHRNCRDIDDDCGWMSLQRDATGIRTPSGAIATPRAKLVMRRMIAWVAGGFCTTQLSAACARMLTQQRTTCQELGLLRVAKCLLETRH